MRHPPAVRRPVLLLYGDRETGLLAPARRGTLTGAETLLLRCADLTTVIVEGADHIYTDRVDQELNAVRGWLHGSPVG